MAQLTITDRAAYRRYQGTFRVILARFGGRLLAADDHARVVEGTWPYDRIMLIKFAEQQDLDAWAASGDCQRIAADQRGEARAASCSRSGALMIRQAEGQPDERRNTPIAPARPPIQPIRSTSP